jgi:hypothetical protein
MNRALLFFVALMLAGQAAAADEPLYAPEAGWVRSLAIPTVVPANEGSPVQTLLVDRQSPLTSTGDEYYPRNVFWILSPQGLSASSADRAELGSGHRDPDNPRRQGE